MTADSPDLYSRQQLLQGVIESSDDAIISETLQGIITSWNPGAEKLFGFTASEAIGRPMQILIPTKLLDEEDRIGERVARGDKVDLFETVRVGKGGKRIHISVTISAIKDCQGRVVGASKIARDITEHKRAQDTLRDSEARYRTLFETLIEGFCTIEMIFDAAGKPVDYRFLEINPAFERQTGLRNAQGSSCATSLPTTKLTGSTSTATSP